MIDDRPRQLVLDIRDRTAIGEAQLENGTGLTCGRAVNDPHHVCRTAEALCLRFRVSDAINHEEGCPRGRLGRWQNVYFS